MQMYDLYCKSNYVERKGLGNDATLPPTERRPFGFRCCCFVIIINCRRVINYFSHTHNLYFNYLFFKSRDYITLKLKCALHLVSVGKKKKVVYTQMFYPERHQRHVFFTRMGIILFLVLQQCLKKKNISMIDLRTWYAIFSYKLSLFE